MSQGSVSMVIVADSAPYEPLTNSGVALGLLGALGRNERVNVVGAVSSAVPCAVRMGLAALTVRFPVQKWRLAFRRGMLARLLRSSTRDVRLRNLRVPSGLVVHVRNVYRPLRLPYAAFIDTTIADSHRKWSAWDRPSKSLMAYERRYYDHASLIFVAASSAKSSLVSDYAQNPEKITVVGGGTNFPAEPALIEMRSRRASDSVSVLFVGREYQRKGGDIILDATRILVGEGVNICLTIAGCSPDVVDDHVKVVGSVSDRSQLWRYYQEADIFCLPARHEPYGLVVQEAMAAGLPVVVSPIGELPNIVGNAGVVLHSNDATELARELRRLAASPTLRSELGRASVERVISELSWDAVAARMLASVLSS